jgi:broad specificity phosphatase PhoE
MRPLKSTLCLSNTHMEIVLARHGKPKLRHWAWITPRQMREWIQIYNAAEISLHEIPSDTAGKASIAGIIVSSTLTRCVQSARALCKDNSLLIEEVFCEADLPYGNWNIPKLPLSVWGVLFRFAWFCGYSTNAESLAQAEARARSAAERLVTLAKENGSVFLVGHGIMTMLIAKQLLSIGWIGPKRPVNKYWQFCVYHAQA